MRALKNGKAFQYLRTVLLAFLMAAAFAMKGTAASDTMKITAIDLSSANTGEAAMISCAGGSILIDSGDVGTRALFTWLDRNGYKKKKFDVYVSHWHDDHYGNTAEIIRNYKVGKVYVPTLKYMKQVKNDYYKTRLRAGKEVISEAKKKGCKIVYLKKGLTFKVGTIKAKVLYCNGSPRKESWYAVQHINNESAVTMFTGGGVRYLTAGDIQAQAEKRILKSGVNIKADILKLSHHGYDRSNTQAFIKAADPVYAYFTSHQSTESQYLTGESRDSVTRMMKISNVYGTRYNGTIVFNCSGGEIKVSAGRNARVMHQKLTNKSTGKTKKVSTAFNQKSTLKKIDEVIGVSKYKNRQVNADGGLFTGKWKKNRLWAPDKMYAVHTWVQKNGKWYYFDSNGKRLKGWQTIEGKRYYLKAGGARVTGIRKIGGARYYFLDEQSAGYKKSREGAMQTGWKTIGTAKYYFMDARHPAYQESDSGKMMTGFQMIGGKLYYLTNGRLNGYQKADIGKLRTGWMEVDGKRYYAYENGQLASGKVKIDGVEYTFEAVQSGCALVR